MKVELPSKVETAFRKNQTLSMFQLSEAIELSRPTLLQHIRAGILPYHGPIGYGKKHLRRIFTRGDVEIFWRNTFLKRTVLNGETLRPALKKTATKKREGKR